MYIHDTYAIPKEIKKKPWRFIFLTRGTLHVTVQPTFQRPFIQYVDSYISFEENRKSADSPQIVEYLCVQLSFMDKLIYEFQRGRERLEVFFLVFFFVNSTVQLRQMKRERGINYGT